MNFSYFEFFLFSVLLILILIILFILYWNKYLYKKDVEIQNEKWNFEYSNNEKIKVKNLDFIFLSGNYQKVYCSFENENTKFILQNDFNQKIELKNKENTKFEFYIEPKQILKIVKNSENIQIKPIQSKL
jgi:hypothetical protein